MHLETTELLAIFLHHRHDTVAACSALALGEQFVNATAQTNELNARIQPSEAMSVVSRTGDFEHLPQAFNGFVGA